MGRMRLAVGVPAEQIADQMGFTRLRHVPEFTQNGRSGREDQNRLWYSLLIRISAAPYPSWVSFSSTHSNM